LSISAETSRTLNRELERLKKERQQLDEVIRGLEQAINASGGKTRATRKQSGGTTGGGRKPGKRQMEALALITDKPGITPPELTEKMGINGPAIYPVLKSLQEKGEIEKDGRGYKALEAGAKPATEEKPAEEKKKEDPFSPKPLEKTSSL
jgi:DNA-binding PadR family transcriptional regulator